MTIREEIIFKKLFSMFLKRIHRYHVHFSRRFTLITVCSLVEYCLSLFFLNYRHPIEKPPLLTTDTMTGTNCTKREFVLEMFVCAQRGLWTFVCLHEFYSLTNIY
jgi:hypothetical protein